MYHYTSMCVCVCVCVCSFVSVISPAPSPVLPGPLFLFDVHEDVRLVNDAGVEKDEVTTLQCNYCHSVGLIVSVLSFLSLLPTLSHMLVK